MGSSTTCKPQRARIGRTLEFLGSNDQVCVEADLYVTLYPEEPADLEYPGAPSYCELAECRCQRITGYTPDEEEVYQHGRRDRPEWFAALDRIVAKHVQDNWDILGKELHYDAATSFGEAAEAAAWEAADAAREEP